MDSPEATNGALDGDSTDGTDGRGLFPSDGAGGELPDGGAGCVGETEHGDAGDEMECMRVKKCRKEMRDELRFFVCSHRCLQVSRRYQDTLRHHHPPHGRPGALPGHTHSQPAAISIPSKCRIPIHPATALPISAPDTPSPPTPHTTAIQSVAETSPSSPQRPLSHVPHDASVRAVSQWPNTDKSSVVLRLRGPAFKPDSHRADNTAACHATLQLDLVHYQHEQAAPAVQRAQSGR